MFRSLCDTLIRNRVRSGGDSKPLSLCVLHIKVRSISSSSSSIEVSYLINACGLSETQAKSASKKLQFEPTSNPNSVLTFLESYGFSKTHITKLITKNPVILLSDPHKTLKPRFDYLLSRDITAIELANVLSTNPLILNRSIERHFIPFFKFTKEIVGTDRHVFRILQRTCIPADVYDKLMINIQVLRDEGVAQSQIVKYLINQPRTFMMGTEKFKGIVQEVKGMGFDPKKYAFLIAIHVTSAMSKSTWEKKLNAYRKWGWSEEQIENAFKIYPICMRHSEKKILGTMDYLVNHMGISSSLIARCPMNLSYSLEKRIIPRFSVYRSLLSKGLINKDEIRISSLLAMSEESFLNKFVLEYLEPELTKLKLRE
ncbi:transcription termination factor MTERF8, chloroplastic-like isoform X1 [Papaver somniferum]|uniref:transcription termination factor MTERF8, chloroplastic-like isoform X1 n=1 Tax=Papaver somniferum TaxID=3469 RepID=UPI000E70158C|nr:transcription termination factor MTERF8, chloroplastic-like isoform X1 [Papaver somniferum]XP_026412051.1 transcription termination factor MTERF8, chloroplastic-like isoform X1 [Papaver somniferum]XP_026412052.1 transcription termination factor MTERF8, chloroplastic-like isoform X1 [Papaver somniferum]